MFHHRAERDIRHPIGLLSDALCSLIDDRPPSYADMQADNNKRLANRSVWRQKFEPVDCYIRQSLSFSYRRED